MDRLTLDKQDNTLQLIRLYNSTDKTYIKSQLTTYINKYKTLHKLTTKDLSTQIGLSIHTINKITKTQSQYKLDFLTTLIICNYLDILITDILT